MGTRSPCRIEISMGKEGERNDRTVRGTVRFILASSSPAEPPLPYIIRGLSMSSISLSVCHGYEYMTAALPQFKRELASPKVQKKPLPPSLNRPSGGHDTCLKERCAYSEEGFLPRADASSLLICTRQLGWSCFLLMELQLMHGTAKLKGKGGMSGSCHCAGSLHD